MIGPPPPRLVVSYRETQDLVSSFMATLVLLFLSAFLVFGGLANSVREELRCSRAAGQCTVAEPLSLKEETLTIALASIHSTRLGAVRGRRDTSYDVELVTDTGDVAVSRLGNQSERASQKHAIDAFLGDASTPTLDLVLDEPVANGWIAFLFLPFLLLAIPQVWREPHLDIDPAAGSLTVVTPRYYRPALRKVYPLSQIHDVVVETIPADQRDEYVVVLILEPPDAPVRLRQSWNRARHDRVARELGAGLARTR
jgi:hypothetical protein